MSVHMTDSMATLDPDALWKAVLERNPSLDGRFVFAVRTTGVYCRPSCPSRRPMRDNVAFYDLPATAERAGFRACLRCRPHEDSAPQTQIVERACRYLDEHLDHTVTLDELGEALDVSPYHLHRTFKRVMGISPRAYVDARRLETLKEGLRERDDVTTAMYDAGYGSSSRLYERAPAQLGMTPREYQRGGKGMVIASTVVESERGLLLVAATERGLCAVYLGDSESELEAMLAREYPEADIRRDDTAMRDWIEPILAHIAGQQPRLDLPLDVQGTAFQRRVWEALREIPYGVTRSYAEIAVQIGQPTATRAVAQACGANRTAMIVPCHRVIARDGRLSGYRWGVARKRALLDGERAATIADTAR